VNNLPRTFMSPLVSAGGRENRQTERNPYDRPE
jgi:hypothetical protein